MRPVARRDPLLLRRYSSIALTIVALLVGGVALALQHLAIAQLSWYAGVAIAGAPLVWRTVKGALEGHFATDVVATLSILAALALAQPLVALVVVLMQAGGEALEAYAEGRARAAVAALEAAAPRVAHRVRNGRVDDVPAPDVIVGDRLLIRPGDLVPCDGMVLEGESELDASSLTGESLPVRAAAGVLVMSGMLNALGSFHMRVDAPAGRSQYARVVDLVRSAQATKAPLQRLADRYAVWFTPITLALCAVAFAASRDWTRVLSILVVATPCPLILATPVAMIGGINRAARRQVVIRTGGALERLSQVNAVVFDKTGTITTGRPRLLRVLVAPGFVQRDVLRLAAAVEERSSHLLAGVLVDYVRREEPVLPPSHDHSEAPGRGIAAVVDGHRVAVGARSFVLPQVVDGEESARALEPPGAMLLAYVAIDARLAAVVEFAEELRAELPALLAALAERDVRRVLMLSGDHAPRALALAATAGIAEAHGDLLPSDKVQYVQWLRDEGYVVMMVGDGVNDAPALSTADVGVALGGHGGGITSESADVILLVDSLARVSEALDIGRRTLRIARQSIWVGLGLSGCAMLVAAAGAMRPLVGAMLQEAIDVAVILNAVRTSISPRASTSSGHPLRA
ncbi:MAG: hypothetical protein JWO05_2207 [Gemmatimonadetes bacterium]|nr:hypothetical protein [Gemmatimonadota bacterium]